MAKTKVFTETNPAPLTIASNSVTELNEVKTTGIYTLGYPAVGLPNGMSAGSATCSILFCFATSSGKAEYLIQILYRAALCETYLRNFTPSGGWSDWKKVQMTSVS